MVDVYLTPDEEAHAADIAREINANKARLHKKPRVWNPKVDADTMRLQAMRSELALSKVLGLPWHPAILPGGDGKIDIRLPVPTRYGQTIQVKMRTERERDLATDTLNFWDELRADIYVLVWPTADGGGLTLVGWCQAADFWERIFSRPPVRMAGYKYEMKWDEELYDMDLLIEEVKRVNDAALGGPVASACGDLGQGPQWEEHAGAGGGLSVAAGDRAGAPA